MGLVWFILSETKTVPSPFKPNVPFF